MGWFSETINGSGALCSRLIYFKRKDSDMVWNGIFHGIYMCIICIYVYMYAYIFISITQHVVNNVKWFATWQFDSRHVTIFGFWGPPNFQTYLTEKIIQVCAPARKFRHGQPNPTLTEWVKREHLQKQNYSWRE